MKVVILGVSIAAAVACRGSQPDASKTHPPEPSVVRQEPPPLDDDATRLPDGFASDDIERVFQSLRTAGKSEFETTDAYRERLATEAKATNYNFLVDPLEVTYDADARRMLVRLWVKVDPSTVDIEEDTAMLPVRNKVERTTFPASNAFGVNVQVERTMETAHGLAAAKVPAQLIGQRVSGGRVDGRYQRFLEIRMPMTPDEARQRKESLRVLYRARPATHTKQRTHQDSYEWKATINSPTSRVTESYSVYVDVFGLAVWVVDTSRRVVLTKTTLAELLKMKVAR